MSKRVLFLYISPSSGHQHAADAIREALSLLEPNWETFGVDSFTYAYPKIGKLIARAYLEVLRRTPTLWNYVYDNPDVETATREIREVLNLISAPRCTPCWSATLRKRWFARKPPRVRSSRQKNVAGRCRCR